MMPMRRLQSVSAAVVVALAAILSLPAQAAEGQVQSEPFDLKAGADQVAEVKITVPAGGEKRIVFGSLRSTARLDRIAVVGPDGSVASSSSGDDLMLVPRNEATQPERGDVYRIVNVEGARPGLWTVRFTVAAGQSGRILGAYGVRPRFEVFLPHMNGSDQDAEAGVPTTVLVMPIDAGKPLVGLYGVEVWVEDSRGATVAKSVAGATIKTALGVAIELPKGQYAALVKIPKAGTYVVKAAHSFGGLRVVAERPLVVTTR